jgi:hypothetical protein
MDKFLDACNQPKLKQDDVNHLNSPITCNEIEAVIKSLLTKKSPGPIGFIAEFYQTFKEELTPAMQGWFKMHKSTNVIQYISRSKEKNHMNLSIDAEKTFNKINHLS